MSNGYNAFSQHSDMENQNSLIKCLISKKVLESVLQGPVVCPITTLISFPSPALAPDIGIIYKLTDNLVMPYKSVELLYRDQFDVR